MSKWLWVIFFIIFIRVFFLMTVKVKGRSMEPTLKSGDLIICLKNRPIKRIDITIVKIPGKTHPYIKRIIGLPGDRVQYINGQLLINGRKINESYLEIKPKRKTPHTKDLEVTIPPGHYYILGDNRIRSVDSRSLGPVKKEQIIARATFLFYPVGRLRYLD